MTSGGAVTLTDVVEGGATGCGFGATVCVAAGIVAGRRVAMTAAAAAMTTTITAITAGVALRRRGDVSITVLSFDPVSSVGAAAVIGDVSAFGDVYGAVGARPICASSAVTSSAALKRSAAFLRSERWMISFIPGEIPGLTSTGSVGSSRMICVIVSVIVSPANGRRPVAISYSTTPSEKTSARPSMALPRACSGDM